MPLNLDHSPADILREVMIDLSLGTDPDNAGSWPIFSPTEPDKPDAAITTRVTTNRASAKNMVDGEVAEFFGVQVRIRHSDPVSGYDKASDIQNSLDKSVKLTSVTLASPTATYLVYSVSRGGAGIIHIGTDGISQRHLYTLNVLATIRQTA